MLRIGPAKGMAPISSEAAHTSKSLRATLNQSPLSDLSDLSDGQRAPAGALGPGGTGPPAVWGEDPVY